MNIEPTPPRSKKTKDTKEKIYRAAAALIKKYGYDYLTVKNVCQAAGVSNGTFFYHFNTKEDLLSYYLIDGLKKYMEEINYSDSGKNYRECLLTYYQTYVSYCVSNGLDFITNYYSPKNKALNTRAHRGRVTDTGVLYEYTTNCCQRGIDEGALSTRHSAIDYANNCCTILKGIIFDWALSDGETDMPSLVNELLGAYLDSISTK